MRKPRDFDSELKALEDRARDLRTRKVQQLGELVIVTGADALDIETLTGGLLAIVATDDTTRREKWRQRGDDFFRAKLRTASNRTSRKPRSAGQDEGGAQPASGEAGTA